MEILSKTLIIIFKIIVSIFFTIIVVYNAFTVLVCSTNDESISVFQILFYFTFSLFVLIGLWIFSFIRINKVIKLTFIILFIIYCFSPKFLPSVMQAFKIDSCLDSGGCWNYKEDKCETHDQSKCVSP